MTRNKFIKSVSAVAVMSAFGKAFGAAIVPLWGDRIF